MPEEQKSEASPVDAFLKGFPLAMIFRSIVPGGLFLFALWISYPESQLIAEIDGKDLIVKWLPIAVLAGTAAYAIHRSMIFPWIEALFDSKGAENCRKQGEWSRLIGDKTLARLFTQWRLSAKDKKQPREAIWRHVGTWADYTHLQYASAQCVIVGMLYGRISGGAVPTSMAILAALLALGSLSSDWRLHTIVAKAITETDIADVE
jgi:hypothetical protein